MVGYAGDGGPAVAAQLNNPAGLTIDSAGDLFFSDRLNNVVREVTPAFVVQATPTLSTIPGGTIVVGSGAPLTDSATLSGGYSPSCTITFTLYGPDGTTVVDTETVTVNGNGTYSTPPATCPAPRGFTSGWSVIVATPTTPRFPPRQSSARPR